MTSAGCRREQLQGIAYTVGPGLAGALLVGAAVGRALAWALGVPGIGVHHMEGHLQAARLDDPALREPFLCLLVSGGHTQLVDVRAHGDYRILGESRDDAVGEAFDKTAKLLGLGYPGGAALAELATRGNAERFMFPRPMLDRPGLEFSFSGLKTHVQTTLRSCAGTDQDRADVACAFEIAVVETLLAKSQRALQATGYDTLVVAGGVGANRRLREALTARLDARVQYPRVEFCTDNGAMIAYAGCLRLAAGQQDDLSIAARPRWPISELSAPAP